MVWIETKNEINVDDIRLLDVIPHNFQTILQQ